MKNKELKDGIRFEETGEGVVFNHYSFCEIIKHIMVKYGHITYKTADEKLQQHFLIKTPKSLDEVAQITHELEFHWAMLVVHGKMYWTKGVPSDYIDFKGEYLAWEAAIRLKYQLKESYEYYDIPEGKTTPPHL
jgi:hypothetical protein